MLPKIKLNNKEQLKELIREHQRKAISSPFESNKGSCHFSGIPIGDEYVIYNYSKKKRYNVHPLYIHEPNSENAFEFEGQLYNKEFFSLVNARDTKRQILRKDAYRLDTGSYIENPEGYIYLKRFDRYVAKEDAIEAKDTGNLISKEYSYYDGTGYFEFSELSRDARYPLYYDYTQYDKEDPNRCIGVEFEFGDSFNLQKAVLRDEELRNYFMCVRDGSLDNINQGSEFVSVPLRLDEVAYYVRKLINLAMTSGATIHDSCGYHVHISGERVSFFDLGSLISLCKVNEKEFLNMFPPSRGMNNYCKRLTSRFNGFTKAEKRSDRKIAGDELYRDNNANFATRHENGKYVDARGQRGIRYYWLNIDRMYQMRKRPEQKTIEFRQHEATFDADRFIGFIYLSYYLVQFAKNHSKKTASQSTLQDVKEYAMYSHQDYIQNFFESSKEFIEMNTEKPKRPTMNIG